MINTISVMASDGEKNASVNTRSSFVTVCVNVCLVLYTSEGERETPWQQRRYQEPRTIKQLITAADKAFRKTTDEGAVTLH